MESARKIAIVTRGSRGDGPHHRARPAARGVDSVFTYDSNATEAAKVVDLVAEAGACAVAL